uniref:C1q domain-containing protein n=1 Tax=Pinctada fucata TaxID=50426 RepID=A0A194AMS4_PINFU
MATRALFTDTVFVFVACAVVYTSAVQTLDALDDRLLTVEKILNKVLIGRNTGNLTDLIDGSVKIAPGLLDRGYPPVMFYAERSSGISGISSGFILKFNNVFTNVGGHYYPADGVFIAPIDGMYLFHWQFITGTTAHGYTGLKVNGSWKARSYTDDRSLDGSANMAIIEVKAKQHVWVETFTSGMYLQDYSSFSGVLINII